MQWQCLPKSSIQTESAKQKMFDNLQQLSRISNVSEAQGTKRLLKLLIFNTYTCIYILNFHVCIKLHGYVEAHIVFTVLHAEVHRVFEVKGFVILRVKKTCSWDFKFTLICYFKILNFSCMWCNDEQLVKILILEHQSSNNQGLAVALILVTAWHLMALCILDIGDTEMVCFLHVDAGRCCLW